MLIPEGIGEIATARTGVDGAPTIPAPGTTQALGRTEVVAVEVDGRIGTVPRPNLIAALIGKAAARISIVRDPGRPRHCTDFVVLAGLVAARDFRETELTKKDRSRLRTMVDHCRQDSAAMLVENAVESLDRLERAARLND